jgi:hypothetical protein
LPDTGLVWSCKLILKNTKLIINIATECCWLGVIVFMFVVSYHQDEWVCFLDAFTSDYSFIFVRLAYIMWALTVTGLVASVAAMATPARSSVGIVLAAAMLLHAAVMLILSFGLYLLTSGGLSDVIL